MIKVSKVSTTRNGIKRWRLDGHYHRDDGPAVDYPSGYKEYWVHGKLHRLDGPAIETPSGRNEWWQDGKMIKCDWGHQDPNRWLTLFEEEKTGL